MNPLIARNETLGELRRKLRARLGFIVSGPAAENNRDVLDSFLQEGHDYIYEDVQPTPLRKKTVIKLQPGSWRYDWHNDQDDEPIDPALVDGVYVVVTPTDRRRLRQGIAERLREDQDLRQHPTRYDTLDGQIELFPVPDQPYDLVIEYTAGKARFTQDQDRPSVPSRLVFLYALSKAKAHYRHPDAAVEGQTFTRMLGRYKAGQHENRRYVAGTCAADDPQVVRAADGYTLRY